MINDDQDAMSYMLPSKICGDVIQSEGEKGKIEEKKGRRDDDSHHPPSNG
jgi:hypothetical protein